MHDVATALKDFLETRENARRFHLVAIGDVNPERCWSDFLVRIGRKDVEGLARTYGSERTKTALSALPSGVSGGFLVPPELRLDLMRDVAEESLFRSRATVIPMTGTTLALPIVDATSTATAGKSPFFGGIQMQWRAEAATRPETEPAVKQILLTARDLTGVALASRPLMQDGGLGLDAWLRRLFARSIAWYEDYAFLRGDGVSEPLGILTSAACISVSRASGSDIQLADPAGMVAKLLPGSWGKAIWGIHPSGLAKLAAVSGWQINQPHGEPGAVGALHGRPLFATEKLPALGTRGDLTFFDPSLYVIGDRQAIEVDVSSDEPTAFLANQMAWRITERVDGQPWLPGTVTLADGAQTAAMAVALN